MEPLLLQGDEVAKKYEPLVQVDIFVCSTCASVGVSLNPVPKLRRAQKQQHAQKIKEMAEAKAKEMTKKE